MTIEFHCPTCSKLLRTDDDKAGVRAKCPDCGTPVTVPSSDDSGKGDGDDTTPDPGGAPPIPGRPMRVCPMCGETVQAVAVRCRFCGEALTPTLAARSYAGEFVYAGFWLRFCASFVDSIIVNVLSGILGFFLGIVVGIAMMDGDPEMRTAVAEILGGILGVIVAWLYAALQECSGTQATLGKRMLGLRVTDLDGNRISFGRATGRHFGKLLSAAVLLIGFLMAGFTERKQALHDMLAGCLVIKK